MIEVDVLTGINLRSAIEKMVRIFLDPHCRFSRQTVLDQPCWLPAPDDVLSGPAPVSQPTRDNTPKHAGTMFSRFATFLPIFEVHPATRTNPVAVGTGQGDLDNGDFRSGRQDSNRTSHNLECGGMVVWRRVDISVRTSTRLTRA